MTSHYRQQARKHGLAATSTMDDVIIREKEYYLIQQCLEGVKGRVLDVGCGNGYVISKLAEARPDLEFFGVDSEPEMITLCQQRDLNTTTFFQYDATNIKLFDSMFSFVYTERCLINLPNWQEQQKALREIHRVLKPKGKFLLIECFTNGLENLNRARQECGLPKLKPKPWNCYLDKQKFSAAAAGFFKFLPCQSNFLSTHFFISRVLHALVTENGQRKNTEFVKFFNEMLFPAVGNYAPLQAFLLEKT